MCRTGGRRCSGSSGTAKNTLRQQIHRARRAVDAARAAGDTAAVAAGEARIEAATTALNALKQQDQRARESAAQQGDVTPPPTVVRADTERDTTAVDNGLVVDMRVTDNHGVVIGRSVGPVRTGHGVQIIGGSWDDVDREPDAAHRAARQAARAERQEAREQRHQARQERRRAREARWAAQAGDVTTTGHIWGGVHMGTTSRDDNVRFGDVTNNTGVVMGSNTGGIYVSNSTSKSHARPGDDAEHDAEKAARKAAKKAKKKAKKERTGGDAGDVIIGRQVGGVVQGDGYTIVGGNVYRHPGRPVSVRGTAVTDAITGQPLTPTHTVANPAAGNSVVHRGGVLYVNGERID
ncbi:hypothetical protein [Kutzneria chonburiensis]|uniref:Uncharacterized protein n=1 Tax=Kutzneria chonburiensis TaxID=1483604 RepID=A0ABV6N2Y1_9PSEU|nr:hypothetical protein [Kutzneria chonburiensis]